MENLTIEELKKQLDAAKQEAHNSQKAAAIAAEENEELKNKVLKGDKVLPIKGEYKGYRFDDGQRRVRNRKGQLCDTEKLLGAAADKDAEAIATLDWLIQIKYAHFSKK